MQQERTEKYLLQVKLCGDQLINILRIVCRSRRQGGAKWSSIILRLYNKQPQEPDQNDVFINDHDNGGNGGVIIKTTFR